MADSRTIGIFGAGWVGLVTGGCFAELGHEVIVRDVVAERVTSLQGGGNHQFSYLEHISCFHPMDNILRLPIFPCTCSEHHLLQFGYPAPRLEQSFLVAT